METEENESLIDKITKEKVDMALKKKNKIKRSRALGLNNIL